MALYLCGIHTMYIRMQYICFWQTVHLVNWDVMHIGGHSSLANGNIECTVFIILVIISSVDVH